MAGFRSQKIQYLLFRTISGVGSNQGRTQHVYDYDAGQEPHDREGPRDSGDFMDELLMGEKASHKKIGNEHNCAHLYLLVRKKSSRPTIDSLKNINTKHDLKNFHHEQNTLPNAPLKMTIRASEEEVIGATFPVRSLTNNITGWAIERSGENPILLQKLHLVFWTSQLICQ